MGLLIASVLGAFFCGGLGYYLDEIKHRHARARARAARREEALRLADELMGEYDLGRTTR